MSAPRFKEVYTQFLSEMGLTFPELDKSAEKALKKTGYVEFSKCIAANLHKFALRDGSIFTDAGVEIAPGVVMTKALWKDAGKATQKAIWDFLSSLTLLSSYEMKHNGPKSDGPVDDDEAFNKFFDISGADVDLKKMFKDLGSDFSGQSFNSFFDGIKEAAESFKNKFTSADGEPMKSPIPEKLFKGHIAKIAEELAKEFKPEDFGLSPELMSTNDSAAIFEYLQQVFSKNPETLMKGAKKIAQRIQDKLKRGEVKRSELIAEAEELMAEFQNNPMFKEIFSQLGQQLKTAGGADSGEVQASERRKAVQERLKKKLAEKQAAAAAKKQ